MFHQEPAAVCLQKGGHLGKELYKSTKPYQPVLVPENVSRGSGQQGRGTLCGRLGQALRSSIYADFREGQLTLVNIVGVNA